MLCVTFSFVAQLFGSPTSVGNSPLLTQTNVSKTPTNTPTATPPPPIVSPPAAPVTGSRKSSGGSESSTVHHMAQTPHQANGATLLQGQGLFNPLLKSLLLTSLRKAFENIVGKGANADN